MAIMLAANMMNVEFNKLSLSQTALDALKLCCADRVRLLPVVDEQGRMVGVVSTGALVKAAFSRATAADALELMRNIDGLAVKKAGDIMDRGSSPFKGFLSLLPDAPASQVASLFSGAAPGVETVFVLDSDARLLGVITIWDFLKRISAYAEKAGG